MDAKVTHRDESGVTLQVRVEFGPNVLESERRIQDAVNAVASAATSEALGQFDTDGDPIVVGGIRMTAKGVFPKEYQTPYGPVVVERYTYQPGGGGRTFCPLEDKARIPGSATPRFAMQISRKYAEFGAGRVCEDLEECHGCKIAKSFVQNTADMVAAVALAKEEDWSYAIPKLEANVQTVSIGLDGTCISCATMDGEKQWWELSHFLTRMGNAFTRPTFPPLPNTARKRSWPDWSEKSCAQRRCFLARPQSASRIELWETGSFSTGTRKTKSWPSVPMRLETPDILCLS
ncbi:MAG: hypothetical protein ING65_03290 [Rhodocyclaceae bacterium]|nr:hypothetical protein [Rhodocyclaceae bacterium]